MSSSFRAWVHMACRATSRNLLKLTYSLIIVLLKLTYMLIKVNKGVTGSCEGDVAEGTATDHRDVPETRD